MARILFCIILIICIFPIMASAAPVKDAFVEVELITDNLSIQPGQPFWIGLRMDMDDEWMVYWKNPGDSGLPTFIDWDLPEGYEVSGIKWPYPVRKDYSELSTYNYEDEVILLSEITPPEHLPEGGEQEIKAHVGWLSCRKMCVQGEADLSLRLGVKDEEPAVDYRVRGMFEETKKHWPVKEEDLHMQVKRSGDFYVLNITAPDSDDLKSAKAEFFPERSDLIDHAARQEFAYVDGGYRLTVKGSVLAMDDVKRFKGVLVLEGKANFPEREWFDFKQAYEVDTLIKNKSHN